MGCRDIFIYHPEIEERLSVLYPDTLETLEYLCSRSYTLGIISNTAKTREEMLYGLERNDMLKYFQGAIVISDGVNLCKKGCPEIFNLALTQDGIEPSNAVMVGDKYKNDVLGAKKCGIYAILVDRKKRIKGGAEDAKISQISELKNLF